MFRTFPFQFTKCLPDVSTLATKLHCNFYYKGTLSHIFLVCFDHFLSKLQNGYHAWHLTKLNRVAIYVCSYKETRMLIFSQATILRWLLHSVGTFRSFLFQRISMPCLTSHKPENFFCIFLARATFRPKLQNGYHAWPLASHKASKFLKHKMATTRANAWPLAS